MKHQNNDDIPREIQIQQIIRGILTKTYNLCPYDVLYVDQKKDSLSILKISVWIEEDIDQIKEIIGYQELCDKSGYIEFRENNTVILRGIALLSFMRAVGLID